MITFVSYRPEFTPDLLAIWHAAFGEQYPIMPALWDAITAGDPSFRDADAFVASTDGDYRRCFAGCAGGRADRAAVCREATD